MSDRIDARHGDAASDQGVACPVNRFEVIGWGLRDNDRNTPASCHPLLHSSPPDKRVSFSPRRPIDSDLVQLSCPCEAKAVESTPHDVLPMSVLLPLLASINLRAA